jgi:hypothetical protein
MAREPSSYRKLTGVHRALGAMTQLWAASDHLLHVNSTGYTENYRRLYFREIQTMLLVHTARRTYIHLTLLVLFLLVVTVMMPAGWITWLVVASIFAPLFAWNHLRGPGCRVIVVTAVAQENIAALSRLPKTRKVLATLEPLIRAAQADLVGPAAVTVAPAVPPPLAGPDAPPPLAGSGTPPPLAGSDTPPSLPPFKAT